MFVLLAGIEMYFNLHTGNINLQTGIHWIIRFQLMTESRVLRQNTIPFRVSPYHNSRIDTSIILILLPSWTAICDSIHSINVFLLLHPIYIYIIYQWQ